MFPIAIREQGRGGSCGADRGETECEASVDNALMSEHLGQSIISAIFGTDFAIVLCRFCLVRACFPYA